MYVFSALIVVVLAIVGGAYLYLVSEADGQLRERIETALEDALERDVRLAGKLTVALAPLPTLTLRDATVANPAWATYPLMLSAGELRLQPELLKLLTGRVVLRSVGVRDVSIWLENGINGRASWRLRDDRESSGGVAVSIHSAQADNVDVVYLDARDGVRREMSLDSVRITARSETDPLDLDVEGSLLDLPWTLQGQIGSFAELNSARPFTFDIRSRLGGSELLLDGQIADMDFRDWSGIRIRFDAGGERPYGLLAWTDLPLPETRDFRLRGELIGRGERLAVDHLSADFGTDDYRLRFEGAIGDLTRLADVRVEFEAQGRSPADIVPWVDPLWLATDSFEATGLLTGSQPDFAFGAIDLSATIDRTRVRLEGRTSDILGQGDLDLQLEVRGENVGAVSRLSRIPVPDVDVLDLSGRLSGTWDDTRLSGVVASMQEGSIRATATGHIEDLTDLGGIDLAIDVDGGDLEDIREILGLRELVQTDSATGRLRLTGNRHDLNLTIESARLERGSLVLEGNGRFLNLVDAPRLDLRPALSGVNVRELGDMVGTALPATDQFRVTGRLVGPAQHPDLKDMDARARLGNILVQLTGELPDVLYSRRFTARGSIVGDDLSLLGNQFDQTWPQTTSFRFVGQASGTWEQPDITDLEGTLVEERLQLQIAGRVGDILNGRGVDVVVQASAPSLNPLVAGDSAVLDRLGEVTGEFRMVGGPEHFDLDVREMRAGSSVLRGEFDLVIKDKRISRLEGNPVASRIDLSPWFLGESSAQRGDGGSGPGPGQPSRIFSDEPLPVEWLEDLDVTLDLSDVMVTIGGGQTRIVDGLLDIDDGEMRIGPLSLDYEGNTIAATMTVRAGPPPSFDARVEGKGFDIGSFVRRIGVSSKAQGRVDLEIDLATTGRSLREMAASARGRWAMLMTEGFFGEVVLNLRFSQMLGGLLPWARQEAGVKVECGILDLPIENGVARAHLLVLDTPEMLMRGRGRIDLGEERYDLLLMPRPKRGRALAHHANVRVRGSFRDPEFSIDASDTTTRVAGAVGRFALLGPAGLFVSTDTFRQDRQECAESLANLGDIE